MSVLRGNRDPNRAAEMRAMYVDLAMSLQQIGDEYGVTRERVRQILKRLGITREDGGRAAVARIKMQVKEARYQRRKDARAMRCYGCDHESLLAANDGKKLTDHSSHAWRYQEQKGNASSRGVGWEISLPDWVRIWRESGQYENRGIAAGQYVMARKGDVGPYSVDNVYIVLSSQNIKDGYQFRRDRGIPINPHARFPRPGKGGLIGRGRGWTLIKRQTNRPYQVVFRDKYVGCFATQVEAEAAYRAKFEQWESARAA